MLGYFHVCVHTPHPNTTKTFAGGRNSHRLISYSYLKKAFYTNPLFFSFFYISFMVIYMSLIPKCSDENLSFLILMRHVSHVISHSRHNILWQSYTCINFPTPAANTLLNFLLIILFIFRNGTACKQGIRDILFDDKTSNLIKFL